MLSFMLTDKTVAPPLCRSVNGITERGGLRPFSLAQAGPVQYTAARREEGKMMTTMLEVAKRAGVSKATVSRVLSGNGYTSQETRDRVFQAIEESGYRPNLLARQLATKNTQTLGLVVTNTLYHGVYFSELLSHAARLTEDRGRQLILADGKHSAEEERQAIQYLLDSRCDGVIIYPRFLSVEEMDELIEQHSQPIMVLNRRLRRHPAHCVYSDQQAAAAAVVDRLVGMGHSDIAFITGSADSPIGMERLAGYREALARHDIPVQEALIAPGKWTPACGAAAVSTLLARGMSFSALIASNDDMAIGAIKQLHECGVSVPEQVSVVGFDDIALAPYVIPSLASVKMPVTEMIQETINRLIAMVEEGEPEALPSFSGKLVRRDSLKRLLE
ncbi:HTH-type transcriptional regulator AscG [compost metagenome]